MTSFIESPRFPDNISYGSAGGPGFSTYVFEGHSGIELRAVQWSRARARYNVSYGIRDKDDMDTVRQFFYNARGKALGFRFKDWGDFELSVENIGTGDGTNRVFKLIKTYDVGNSYVRRIFKPVSGTLHVFVDGVEKTETTHWVCDYATGIITFTVGNAPPNLKAVTATCEFDVPVRFDTDNMNASHDGFQTESWGGIPLVEILLEEP